MNDENQMESNPEETNNNEMPEATEKHEFCDMKDDPCCSDGKCKPCCKIWPFVLTVVVTATLVGGGVYYWQSTKLKTASDCQLIGGIYTDGECKLAQLPESEISKDAIEAITEIAKSKEAKESNTTTTKTDTTTDAGWKLVSGDPKDTCSKPTYSGSVDIRGWYSYTEIDDEHPYSSGWNFNVVTEDIKKLPLYSLVKEYTWFNQELRIMDATSDLEAKLKKATKEKPVTVTLKGYSSYCEGPPRVSIKGAEDLWKN